MPVLPKLPQKDDSKELPSLVLGGNLIAPLVQVSTTRLLVGNRLLPVRVFNRLVHFEKTPFPQGLFRQWKSWSK